jgi:hypothetical protein
MTAPAADQERPDSGTAAIHERYRKILGRPDLTDQELAEMRQCVIRLARTICEHVWGKKFY